MKFKSVAVMAAVSFGMLFVGATQVNANSSVKHTVQAGDTISGLSQQYKVSQNKIKKANKNKNINTIYIGEVFVFDGKGNVKVDKKSSKASTKSSKATSKTNSGQVDSTTTSSDTTSTTSGSNTVSNSNNSSNTTQSSAPAAKSTTPVATRATTPATTQAAPVAKSSASVASNGTMSGIAQAESGNNYNARNGQYIGKYQLSSSYLNGDYSPENQERVAQQYAVSRYGSVESAAAYHAAHGSW